MVVGFDRCRLVGGRGRVRRPPHPLRPARCRCRVRVGVGLGCGRPARGERAAKTRTALPAFLRKDPFAFLLHFAACRAETLLRSDNWLMEYLRDGWYGERRALTSRFLSPEPLSFTAGRWNGLRGGNGAGSLGVRRFSSPEPLSCTAGRWSVLCGDVGAGRMVVFSPESIFCTAGRCSEEEVPGLTRFYHLRFNQCKTSAHLIAPFSC